MKRAPRGTTLRKEHRPGEGRQKPWGVFWNVYKIGFVGRPKITSEWFATQVEADRFIAKMQPLLLAQAEGRVVVVDRTPVNLAATSLAALAGFDYDYDRAQDDTGVGPKYRGWLAEVESVNEANTLRTYADVVRNWLAPPKGHRNYPGLGTLIVSEATCTYLVVKDYLLKLHKDGVSQGRRARLRRTLSAFCSWARDNGYLKHNPCAGQGRKKLKGDVREKPKPNPFTGAEVTRILDYLLADEPDWYGYFLFLLDVGVRIGEIASLKWTALDLDQKRARIELAYSEAAKADKVPKSHETRSVDLTQRVVDWLRKWKVRQAEAAMKRGHRPPAYVFTTPRGGRMLPSGTMREVFARMMTTGAIEGHRPHNFRHTFATSHLMQDWNRKLAWVSTQLGHATPQTTVNFYFEYRPTTATAGFADEIVAWGK